PRTALTSAFPPRRSSDLGLASDTSRWGGINAMYYEKTGDAQAREDAFRSLNYATYFAASDGKISCCGQGFGGQYWFDDGYGDYIDRKSTRLNSSHEWMSY